MPYWAVFTFLVVVRYLTEWPLLLVAVQSLVALPGYSWQESQPPVPPQLLVPPVLWQVTLVQESSVVLVLPGVPPSLNEAVPHTPVHVEVSMPASDLLVLWSALGIELPWQRAQAEVPERPYFESRCVMWLECRLPVVSDQPPGPALPGAGGWP